MRILLVEANYKNKYPPIGLMKISTYHKSKKDYVYFVKGNNKEIAKQLWDRIYVTTLFTFNFKETVETIRYYKESVLSTENIYVGGILASLMPDKIREATGINNVLIGQLTSSSRIGFSDNVNIDELPLDYDILDDCDYSYPAGDNYISYTTRGCPNHCSFCAVPKLELEFKTVNHIKEQVETVDRNYGPKRNLLLLDNNILKSSELRQIVEDIYSLGFTKKATFTYPNLFPILFRKVMSNLDDKRHYDHLKRYLIEYVKNVQGPKQKAAYNLFIEELFEHENPLQLIQEQYEEINKMLEAHKDKRLKPRYVDFNQGIDARLLSEENMAILSKLPLRPLRIAFDNIAEKDVYIAAIKLAHKYGVNEMSNYILYNHNDRPEDLWDRLKINIDLNIELNTHIFSFPMKYAPINEIDRNYIGSNWNRKYLSAVTAILLVTKGIVAGGYDFFHKAFGRDYTEMYEIFSMPREFIIYRFKSEKLGYTEQWKAAYRELTDEEEKWLLDYVGGSVFVDMPDKNISDRLKKVLKFYTKDYELK